MGVVYAAERIDESFRQTAALKLVRAGFAADFRERFVHERAILAGLDHPGVARLLDGGVTDDGTPYIAMELVDGDPITEYCERHNLNVRDRLELFLTGCDAVAYAHHNFVVHRDLKPSHMLVDDRLRPSRVKLLDFGIARLIESDEATLTRTGPGPMTPAYAAPEQLLGNPITTATDVYALGVVLYNLLTGVLPYDLDSLTASQTERVVCDVVPPRPSDVVEERRSGRQLRGDLDQVVLKALAKEPSRRYSTADALAADIRRHLDGLPVVARSDSIGYRLGKFVRRHRLGVGAASLVLAVLITLITLFTASLTRERNRAQLAATEAVDQAERAQAVAGFLEQILRAPNARWYVAVKNKGPDTPIIEVLNEAAARIPIDFANQPDLRADLHHIVGDTYGALGLWDKAAQHHRMTFNLRERLYSPPHPKLAEALYYDSFTDSPADALSKLARAAAMLRLRNEGNNFPFILQSLANFNLYAGRYADADLLAQEAIAFIEESFVPDSDGHRYRDGQLVIHYGMRSYLNAELGRLDDSHQFLAMADSILTRLPQDPAYQALWVDVVCLKGRLAMREGDLEKAEEALSSCVGKLAPTPISSPFLEPGRATPCSNATPSCLAATLDLVALYEHTNRPEDATLYRTEAERARTITDSLRTVFKQAFRDVDQAGE